MPVNVYGGGTGSGKSYQVVSQIIVPQLAKGRRIMTTIRGVKYERICEYLAETEGLLPDQLGKLAGLLRQRLRQEVERALDACLGHVLGLHVLDGEPRVLDLDHRDASCSLSGTYWPSEPRRTFVRASQ